VTRWRAPLHERDAPPVDPVPVRGPGTGPEPSSHLATGPRVRLWDRDLTLVTRERTALNRNYFNTYVWKPALVKAGIEPVRKNGMHALRHYYASVLLGAGRTSRR
jgi:hypothetical protein